jgi:hypothetical protein
VCGWLCGVWWLGGERVGVSVSRGERVEGERVGG